MPNIQDDGTSDSVARSAQYNAEKDFALDAGGVRYAHGFIEQLWCALFRPQRVFGRPFSGYLDMRALLFAMSVVALVPAVQQVLVYLLTPVLVDVLPMSTMVKLFPVRMGTSELVRAVLIIPVLFPIPLALYALVLHVLLKLAQGGERGFAVTLQCVCYASACGILRLFPHSGEYIAIIWWLGVLAVGLRYSHGSAWHRILPVVALHVSAVAWLVSIAAGWVLLPL